MRITRQVVVIDAADIAAESAFWAALLGGEVVVDSEKWHRVLVGGEWRLAVQLAPDHRPPEWPDGTPQQMHIDLWPDDVAAAHAEAVRLGARVLQEADLGAPEGFQVYADPAGHPFCLCWGSPAVT